MANKKFSVMVAVVSMAALAILVYFGTDAPHTFAQAWPNFFDAAVIAPAAIERVAFTISEFCERNGFSKPFYFKMRSKGLAPDELRYGGIVRITAESELAWQRARTNRTGAEAEKASRDSEARRQRAKNAASSAIASPTHIARVKTRRRHPVPV
jgi:hypothetical protein